MPPIVYLAVDHRMIFQAGNINVFEIYQGGRIVLNELLSLIYRPEKGWDPVPYEHAYQYALASWDTFDASELDEIETIIGGFQGKHVLDLGAGSGQYSVEFARRGAMVTWYDISKTYKKIAENKAKEFNVLDRIHFAPLGYLDEAYRKLQTCYDLVFNRVCFYYSVSEKNFAKVIYDLVRQNGFGYIYTNNSKFRINETSKSFQLRTWLNEKMWLKVGHPHPPRGRVAKLILNYPVKRLWYNFQELDSDRIIFEK